MASDNPRTWTVQEHRLSFRQFLFSTREETFPDPDQAHVYMFSGGFKWAYSLKTEFSDDKTVIITSSRDYSPHFEDDTMIFHLDSVKRFPHDFTFKGISHFREKRMVSYFPSIHKDFANLSPDLVVKDDGRTYIVEFTTRRLASSDDLIAAIKQKMEKYTPMIDWLISQGVECQFDCIAVSRCTVVSTVPLYQLTADLLCTRYMAALTALEDLKSEFPEIHQCCTDDRSKVEPYDMKPVFQELNRFRKDILDCYQKKVSDIELVNFDKAKFFSTTFKVQQTLVKSSSPSDSKTVNDIVEPGGRVDSSDSISRLPLLIPQKGDIELDESLLNNLDSLPRSLEYLWRSAVIQYQTEPEKFQCFKPAEEKDLQIQVAELQNISQEYKKIRNRIVVPRDYEVEEELAQVGVWGKTHRYDAAIQTRRKFTQQHISVDTDTSDIQDFINSFEDMVTDSDEDLQSEAIELLKFATPHSNWPPHETFKKLRDNVYDALLFLADVCREAACSIASSCSHNEFILKKLPKWQALLLIKPTKSDSHMFISLLIKPDFDFNVGCVFPKPFVINDFNFYQFKSLQVPYIENIMKLPEMYLAMKYNCYIPETKPALIKNLAAGLLIALDNKADAEECITKSRYIYMKGCQIPRDARNPWQVLEGLPTRPRSRLTLFLIKCCVNLCSRIIYMASTGQEEGKDKWVNIPALVSDDYLDNWDQVLTVIYTGYFRNKNSFMSKNQSMAMLEKIVKPEMEFQYDPVYKDRVNKGNANNPTKMEWNTGYMLFCIDAWKRLCNKTGLKNGPKHVTDSFIKALSTIRLEDLATLKASNIDLDNSRYEYGKPDKPRKKMILILKERIKEYGPTLLTALPRAIKEIKERGGTMMISLFKKAQHGGLREIYVMDVASRIVQYCVETLGRIICSTFQNEAMSHPDVKTRYRQDHMWKVEQFTKKMNMNKATIMTAFDNDDAEKWNQYHIMNKFAYMLRNMTEPLLHGFIDIALSQWLNKRIRMESSMLDSIYKNQFHSKSEVAMEIINGFKGVKTSCIAPALSRDLHIESGMMQGLLHFTSSALHSLCLLGYEEMAPEFVKSQVRKLEVAHNTAYKVKIITTHAVTSDDSICANTIISSMDQSHCVAFGLLACSALKIMCSRMMGITSSKKKASLCTAPISEFNSQWMDRQEVIRPRARHILACFNYASLGNFMEQMDNFASLRQQALESGVCIHQVSFINLLQGLYFYRLLGSGSGEVFGKMVPYFKRLPDPNCGFFLMDPPIASGIVSTDYNAYMMAKKGSLAAKYNHAYQSDDIIAGSYGSLRSATKLAIEFMNFRKHQKLLKEINCQEVREFFDKKPDILFRQAKTLEESEMLIAAKLMQPNVMRSLSKDFSVMTRELSASVYLLWAPLVRPTNMYLDIILGKNVKDASRTSIAQILMEEAPIFENRARTGTNLLYEDTKKWFFPLHEEYDRLTDMLVNIENRVLADFKSNPKSATTIEVFTPALVDYPLPKLCAYKWFNIKDFWESSDALDVYWLDARATYPFLRDSYAETMDHNNIDHAQKLKTLLDRNVVKGKVIRPTSRGGRSVRSTGACSYISYNFKENYILRLRSTVETEDFFRSALRHISMTLQLPFEDRHKAKMIVKEINSIDLKEWKSSNRFCPLSLIHRDFKESMTILKFLRVCRGSNSTVGVWKERQVKSATSNKWVGHGVWVGRLITPRGHCAFEIELQDDEAISIKTDSLEKLSECPGSITKLFNAWGIHPTISESPNTVAYFYKNFNSPTGVPVFEKPSTYFSDEKVGDKLWLRVKGHQMLVMLGNTPVYEFCARSDLIQPYIGETQKKNVLEYVLDNTPIPVDLMNDFLFNEHFGEDKSLLKNWMKDLIQNQNPLRELDIIPNIPDDEIERIFDSISSYTPEEISSLASSEAIKCLHTEDFKALESDVFKESMRIFEAETDVNVRIRPSHFHFLRDYFHHGTALVHNIERRGYCKTEFEQKIYELFRSIEAPDLKQVVNQWDNDELDDSIDTIINPEEVEYPGID
nr:TPA_asm: RNA-dependent RNA polymerase [Trichobi phenuili virus 2]